MAQAKNPAKKPPAKKPPAAKKPAARKTKTKKTIARKSAKAPLFDLATWLVRVPRDAGDIAPTMPAKTAGLEAERLWAAASKVPAAFLALPGFSAALFHAIPHLIKALADAERVWSRLRFTGPAVNLTAVRKQAEELRASVMRAGRYLLRKTPKAQDELDRIAEGEGLADLIADLDDLATFLITYATEMAADAELPKDAATRCQALSKQLREGKDSTEGLDAQSHRNRVYAALAEAVTEARAAARYLYSKQPKRLAPYLSQYEAQRKRVRRAAEKKEKGKAKPPGQ